MTLIDRYLDVNGHSLHIVNLDAITTTYNLPASAADKFFKLDNDLYISTSLTFGDMAEVVLGDSSFDYALPQSFWNSIPNWRDHVWYYGDSSFGRPFNVKASFVAYVKSLLN